MEKINLKYSFFSICTFLNCCILQGNCTNGEKAFMDKPSSSTAASSAYNENVWDFSTLKKELEKAEADDQDAFDVTSFGNELKKRGVSDESLSSFIEFAKLLFEKILDFEKKLTECAIYQVKNSKLSIEEIFEDCVLKKKQAGESLDLIIKEYIENVEHTNPNPTKHSNYTDTLLDKITKGQCIRAYLDLLIKGAEIRTVRYVDQTIDANTEARAVQNIEAWREISSKACRAIFYALASGHTIRVVEQYATSNFNNVLAVLKEYNIDQRPLFTKIVTDVVTNYPQAIDMPMRYIPSTRVRMHYIASTCQRAGHNIDASIEKSMAGFIKMHYGPITGGTGMSGSDYKSFVRSVEKKISPAITSAEYLRKNALKNKVPCSKDRNVKLPWAQPQGASPNPKQAVQGNLNNTPQVVQVVSPNNPEVAPANRITTIEEAISKGDLNKLKDLLKKGQNLPPTIDLISLALKSENDAITVIRMIRLFLNFNPNKTKEEQDRVEKVVISHKGEKIGREWLKKLKITIK